MLFSNINSANADCKGLNALNPIMLQIKQEISVFLFPLIYLYNWTYLLLSVISELWSIFISLADCNFDVDL